MQNQNCLEKQRLEVQTADIPRYPERQTYKVSSPRGQVPEETNGRVRTELWVRVR